MVAICRRQSFTGHHQTAASAAEESLSDRYHRREGRLHVSANTERAMDYIINACSKSDFRLPLTIRDPAEISEFLTIMGIQILIVKILIFGNEASRSYAAAAMMPNLKSLWQPKYLP